MRWNSREGRKTDVSSWHIGMGMEEDERKGMRLYRIEGEIR